MFGFIRKYKLFIIVAILVLIGAAVYQFALVDDDGNVIFLTKDGAVSGSVVGREVVGLLDELESIDISGAILQDPAFKALIDFQKGVGRESIGRSNPFAPLGSSGGAAGFIELPLDTLGNTLPTVP